MGPMGPSGVVGSMPEAPTDGSVYGRQGNSGSWLGVLPLTGGNMSGPTAVLNPSTADPVVPGYLISSRYGTQSAVDIFGKTLSVPTRNTFNVIEGVLTLPATITDFSTYHTAICAFISNQSSKGVGYGIGAHVVAEANNCLTGGFGGISVDSPKNYAINGPSGIYNGVRLQNEFDWYTNNATTSVRATLHDGYFLTPPNSTQSNIAYSNNIFDALTVIANASFSGSVMTVNSVTSGTFVVGQRLQATGVDGTAYITVTSFGTGTGLTGTYNLSANVGTIASTYVRGSASFLWNISFQSPDGASQVAFDVGQRNFATTLSIGSRSQPMWWRYTDNTVASERILQQWVEPLAAGCVMYLQNYSPTQAASYGIRNYFNAPAAYLGRNQAETGWIDMLHLDVNDRTVLGFGSAATYLYTTAGLGLELLDDGVTTAKAVAMKAGTAALPSRIYSPSGNLQLANTGLSANATFGFTSPFPVTTGPPTGTPALANATNAFGVYNTTSKTLNIFDFTANGWYHVTLTAGAA